MRIVLIDDDRMVLETITLGWPDVSDEFEVFDSFETLRPFLYSQKFHEADCIILDLQLPDISGSQILAEIRKISDVPIIMLSGWGDTDFRADLINRGIDDYVLKPASAKELHARASRLVRRGGLPGRTQQEPQALNGGVVYMPVTQVLQLNGETVELTHAEARLLEVLISASGKAVSRSELYHQAFNRPHKEGEKVLETYISRLRHKLETLAAGTGNIVQTARGVGYRLAIRTD